MKKKIQIIVGILLFINLVILGYHWFLINQPISPDDLRVIFLNVGQGDAILVQEKGKNILIDGGPSREIIHQLDQYLPFYQRKIDLMICTHFDLDHVTGLTEVLKRMPVDRVIFSGRKSSLPASEKWLDLVEEKNIPNEIAFFPQEIKINENLSLEFLWPEKEIIQKTDGSNNFTSLVFKLNYGEISFLFTGDATQEVEEHLLARGDDLKSDVLKVGHHGSKYSTLLEFVQAVAPIYSVISVGENNFNHPHLRVLKNLEQAGTKILRTDEKGEIIFLVTQGVLKPVPSF
jgi:competence protein ComEC